MVSPRPGHRLSAALLWFTAAGAVFGTTPWAGAQTLVPDATYTTAGNQTTIKLPSSTCTSFTATPIVVGDWLLIQGHDSAHGCTPSSAYGMALLAYRFSDGKLYKLFDGVSGEATLLHVPDRNRVYWTTTFGSTVRILEASSLRELQRINVGVTSDSSGTFFNGLFHFGTINTPENICQSPLNLACGIVAAVDDAGNVVRRIDYTQGFRTWVAAGLTTDGTALYVGGSPSHVGSTEPTNLYGCSVVKLDANLRVLKSYDIATPGCQHSGAGGDDEDAVAGETVLGPDSVWVQYHSANDAALNTYVVRLNRDLVEQCKVGFQTAKTKPGAFYGAATVDRDGNAYVPISLPAGSGKQAATLLKLTPSCQVTTIASIAGAKAAASPTLVDDQYVLFATDGRLQQYTTAGELVREFTLGSTAVVATAPVLHQGIVYLVQQDGTLNVIRSTGFNGYGQAYWPRYRRDNNGSGAVFEPQTGWWWNPAEPGRGYFIEQQGGQVFVGAYLYADDGRATWTVAAGSRQQNGFQAGLQAFGGGQSLTGSYRAPVAMASPGNLQITWTAPDAAHMVWPGGTVNLSRFGFGATGGVAPPAAGMPESGWWWNAAESGRGFALEFQGDQLFAAGYLYDTAGNPVWYVSSGTVTGAQQFSGNWVQYGNGQTLLGSYQAPVVVNGNVGTLGLRFSASSSGTLTLPDGRAIPLTRFRF